MSKVYIAKAKVKKASANIRKSLFFLKTGSLSTEQSG
jgi:hypothetical protein